MKGYFINTDGTIGMHQVLSENIEVPANFYETEKLDVDGKALRLVKDEKGNVKIEAATMQMRPDIDVNKRALQLEIAAQQQILDDSDYQVVKCAERGLDFAQKYPKLKEEREEARLKISELRELLK
ncbi:MAG: hypothetical protein ACRCZB_07520 [Bacteroidales bacterium]